MVAVSTGYVGGTCGAGIVSSTAHLLGMSVVRGMRGVGGVCEMCMCLAGGCVEERGLVDERIGFGLYQSCVNRGSVGRVSVFGLRLCACCWWGVGRGLGPECRGVGCCYVCVSCEFGFFV